ncbi:hypothetical protein Tco_1523318 [Tanacetum coccineum]
MRTPISVLSEQHTPPTEEPPVVIDLYVIDYHSGRSSPVEPMADTRNYGSIAHAPTEVSTNSSTQACFIDVADLRILSELFALRQEDQALLAPAPASAPVKAFVTAIPLLLLGQGPNSYSSVAEANTRVTKGQSAHFLLKSIRQSNLGRPEPISTTVFEPIVVPVVAPLMNKADKFYENLQRDGFEILLYGCSGFDAQFLLGLKNLLGNKEINPWLARGYIVYQEGGMTVGVNEENEVDSNSFGFRMGVRVYNVVCLAFFHDIVERRWKSLWSNSRGLLEILSKNCLSRLDPHTSKVCEITNLVLTGEKSHFMVKEGIVSAIRSSKNGNWGCKAKIVSLQNYIIPPPSKDIRIVFSIFLAIVYAFENSGAYIIMNKAIVHGTIPPLVSPFAKKKMQGGLLDGFSSSKKLTSKLLILKEREPRSRIICPSLEKPILEFPTWLPTLQITTAGRIHWEGHDQVYQAMWHGNELLRFSSA